MTPIIYKMLKDAAVNPADAHFDPDTDVLTREQLIADARFKHEQVRKYNPDLPEFQVEPHNYPDITVRFRFGGSEGADVNIDLIDTGNDDDDGRKCYDADIHIGNDDSTGPKFMLGALAAAIQLFYEHGLNTRFGSITGDWF